jgi:hypothetical protein
VGQHIKSTRCVNTGGILKEVKYPFVFGGCNFHDRGSVGGTLPRALLKLCWIVIEGRRALEE